MQKGQLANDVPIIKQLFQRLNDANATLQAQNQQLATDSQTKDATIASLQSQLASANTIASEVAPEDLTAADDLHAIVAANQDPAPATAAVDAASPAPAQAAVDPNAAAATAAVTGQTAAMPIAH